MSFKDKYRHLAMCKTEKEALALQDKIRKELFDKLYDYETRPMCYSSPDRWVISKDGVKTT